MIKSITKEELAFDKFISDLDLTNVYDSFIINLPSGPKFIRLNEFDEIEVYEKYDSNLIKIVDIDGEYDDSFSLFFKITKGI
ncbi:hypothetical protein PALS2_109 [Staphylococcus phage PALS_2]|nr:hypothetical protein PALS2_109 [Staphylococcus phage PALS_2]